MLYTLTMNEIAENPAKTWPEGLPFHIALMLEGSKESKDDIAKRHGIDKKELSLFVKDKLFCKQVQIYRGEIEKNGLTFTLKARAQAEELLGTSWKMIHDLEAPYSVRADLIKSTVSWGNLNPKQGNSLSNEGLNAVNIIINLKDEDSVKPIIEAG